MSRHSRACVPKLEKFLDEYIAAAGIADDVEGPLFRTVGRISGAPQRMTQPDAYRMIRQLGIQAGIKTRIGNHAMRATGITDYLKHDGTLENAQQMANHSSPRTTRLYDRRNDEASLDEYAKVGI
jgi:integrase